MKELEKSLKLYEEKFDDIFPMFQMSGKPPNGIIKIINECIEKNKDVYERGH